MANIHSSALRKELESFRLSTIKLGENINSVSNLWKDSNYNSLHAKISELAKASKTVIESGERTCQSVDKFFNIAAEIVF